MTYTYKTSGVCSQRIDVELEGNVIKAVAFTAALVYSRYPSGDALIFNTPMHHRYPRP